MKPGGVSVIIPCYNQGRFLHQALASVSAQTTPPDEIIVVDDGSTDDSAAVASRHAGVRLIRQANQGLSGARNAGMAASLGDYLVFLDADDRLLPDAIRAGRSALDQSPSCAFSYGRFRWITEGGSPIAEPFSLRRQHANAYEALLEGNFIGMHATVMYRRAILVEAGGFDTRLRCCEDYDVYLRIARNHPVCGHEETIAEYRLNPRSLSRDSARMLETVLKVLDSQEPNASDRAERRALMMGRWRWRIYYGELMIDGISRDARRGLWREAWQGLRSVARLCRLQAPFAMALYVVPLRFRQLPRRVLSIVGASNR